ncbi:nucleotide exchange factor GrpE [Buchnera aphidicola]|uniref:nucleotide exchange factor GrpE n=1 Tax=Buchnera aphidicola TaxID=9 RepID=UPI00094D7291|nr:nucleotide exchange factor GrpE [Buchnera aphidicola]
MNCDDMINNSVVDKKKNNSLNSELLLDESLLLEKKKTLLDLEKKLLNKSNKYNENLSKLKERLQKKINITHNFFLEKYFLSILPIVDSIDSAEDLLNDSCNDYSDIYVQIKDIQKNFLSIFTKYQVSVINLVNISFNPDIHQAISIDFSKKYPNNYISRIIQKGYLLKNRLLRPALVSVSQIN